MLLLPRFSGGSSVLFLGVCWDKMRLSVVFKEKRDKFFLIKQFHLIERKSSTENKHCLLLEKFSLFCDKSEPVRASLSLQHFFFFFFPFSFSWFHLSQRFISQGCKEDAEWEGERTTSTVLYSFFVSAIETAWEFGQEAPWMLQGTSREHFASQS